MQKLSDIFLSDNQTGVFLILGYGITGQALAQFLSERGKKFIIIDDKGDDHCSLIDINDVHHRQKIQAVLPSPGVALTHPIVREAIQAGIPVIGDLELAAFFLKGEFIAVTGTNGKSTTVRLINALLEAAGIANLLKGNFGSALITAVSQPPQSYYVLEESSYQLELIGSLRHRVAVCLNVSNDHLDRYAGIDEYALAKAQIIKNSTADDFFIYNHDDPWCLRMSKMTVAKKIPFSLVQQFKSGAYVDKDTMVIALDAGWFEFPLRGCSLVGLHNQENMLAALATVLVIKSDAEAIAAYDRVLKEFVGLPHRLERVTSWAGVDYYDDSKATNVGAVVMALASFDGGVVLIAGGRDKQGDYGPLRGLVKGKVKRLILLGEAKEVIAKALEGSTTIDVVEGMEQAVRVAHSCAAAGDVVLLSPACSSFDQYKNYAERGKDFKRWVEVCCREQKT